MLCSLHRHSSVFHPHQIPCCLSDLCGLRCGSAVACKTGGTGFVVGVVDVEDAHGYTARTGEAHEVVVGAGLVRKDGTVVTRIETVQTLP